jgi:hypothetical protein
MAGLGMFGLWLFLAGIVVVALALAVGTILLGDRVLPASIGQGHNSTLSPFVTTVALVYGALLGFTVVVAWEQFSGASANVAAEASTLTTMYRQTVAMPKPEQQEMRNLLRTYTTAAAGPEWERQDTGDGTSDSARAALTEMYRVLSRQDPNAASAPVNGEFIGQLTVLASERNTRVLDAEPRIPSLLWSGLIFGGVVLITLMGFMRLDSTRGHVLLSGSVAVLLALLLFIIFCLDHPFGMELGVTSAPFEHSLEVFRAVDTGK